MPGVELSSIDMRWPCSSLRSWRGELDVTGAAEAEAAITTLVARDQHLVIDMSIARVCRRCEHRQAAEAIPLAAACGAHCTPWEGCAIAYWHRVTAAGVRVGLESSVPSRTRR